MHLSVRCVLLSIFSAVLLSSTGVSAQSVEELMNQGGALLQNGAYDQAVTKFRKVLGRDPGNFEAQFNLAFAYLNGGRYEQAVVEFRKALAINRQCAECWGNLALAYESQGKDDQALGALHEAVNANPGNIEARMNLATMYANKNRTNDAIAQYKQVIQIDGRNIDAHVNLAKCLVAVKKPAEAKGYLKSALSINPDEAEALWEMGNITWKSDGDREGAIDKYRKAITIQPNSKVFYENYALVLEEMDRKQEAVEVWKKSLVYLDDALKKENIQARIDALERGESPSGKESPEKLFGSGRTKSNVAALQSDVHSGRSEGSGEAKIISTRPANVESDLEGLDETDDGMDFDLKKAVKDKMKDKEN